MKTNAHRETKAVILLGLMLTGVIALPAAAQEGCTGFAWPLVTELAWMKSSDAVSIGTGEKLQAPPAKAIALKLVPSKQVELQFKPGIKQQAIAPDSYSGWFEIAALPEGGLYQITISSHAWIDAVQNGQLVRSQAFTGAKGCEAVRKSVRYQLDASPVTIQIDGAPSESVMVSIREAK